MNTYSKSIKDMDARQARQLLRANFILGLVFVLALLVAIVTPYLAHVSYATAFTGDGNTRFLMPFLTLSVVWFVLAVYWDLPAQFAGLPALTLLCLGYTVTTLALR